MDTNLDSRINRLIETVLDSMDLDVMADFVRDHLYQDYLDNPSLLESDEKDYL